MPSLHHTNRREQRHHWHGGHTSMHVYRFTPKYHIDGVARWRSPAEVTRRIVAAKAKRRRRCARRLYLE